MIGEYFTTIYLLPVTFQKYDPQGSMRKIKTFEMNLYSSEKPITGVE